VINHKGDAKTVAPDLSLHFESTPLVMERWVEKRPITAVYFDGNKERYFIKRFLIENVNKEDNFLKENSKLIFVSSEWRPIIELIFTKPRGAEELPNRLVVVEDFIGVKGFKALGNQLVTEKIKEVVLSESLPYEEEEEETLEEMEVVDPNQVKDNDPDASQIKLEL